jgi:hypothetical protein
MQLLVSHLRDVPASTVKTIRRCLTSRYPYQIGRKQLNHILYGEHAVFTMAQPSANHAPIWTLVACTCAHDERREGELAHVAPAPSAPPAPVVVLLAVPDYRLPHFDLTRLNPFSGATKMLVVVLLLFLMTENAYCDTGAPPPDIPSVELSDSQKLDQIFNLLQAQQLQIDALKARTSDDTRLTRIEADIVTAAKDAETAMDLTEQLHLNERTSMQLRIDGLEHKLQQQDAAADTKVPTHGHCAALTEAYKDAALCIGEFSCTAKIFNSINALRKKCAGREKPEKCAGWPAVSAHLKTCLEDNADCTSLMNEWLEYDNRCSEAHDDDDYDCENEEEALDKCTEEHPVDDADSQRKQRSEMGKCRNKLRSLEQCLDPDSVKARSRQEMSECEDIEDRIERWDCQEVALEISDLSYTERAKKAGGKTLDALSDVMSDVYDWGSGVAVRTTGRVRQHFRPSVGRNGDSSGTGKYYHRNR